MMKRSVLATLIVFLLVPFGGAAQSRRERDRAGMGDVGDDQVKFRGVGWVVIRSPDRDRLADFHRALGFVQGGSSRNVIGLYVGRQAALEVGHLDPDSDPSRTKTSRAQARAVAIFGTTNIQEVVDRAKKADATMIEKVFSAGNDTLYYIGDPDGNVVGFSEIGPMWRDRNELIPFRFQYKMTGTD